MLGWDITDYGKGDFDASCSLRGGPLVILAVDEQSCKKFYAKPPAVYTDGRFCIRACPGLNS